MAFTKVCALSYSATGNTEKMARLAAQSMADALALPLEERPFTTPAQRAREHAFAPTDLVLVGSPTYAGRLPNKIAPDLRGRLQGNGAAAVALVTFGNRAFDNALAELTALLADRGFRVIAAGAFVARHAFTDQLAPGRPDDADRAQLQDFGRQAAEKARSGGVGAPSVPGDPDAPYYIPLGTDGQPAKFLPAKPQTDFSRCTGCGACARLCPMGAIDPNNTAHVPGTCIKCQRCVRRCTRGAKYFDDPAFLSHVSMLQRDCQARRENAVFL